MRVKLKIPATTANMGPGFDCLGCALSLYTYIELEDIPNGLEVFGCDDKYCNEENLVYTSYLRALEYIGIDKNSRGVRIVIDANVPVSRGLGSSATMIVGGVVGANILCGSPLTTKEIFAICNEIEGHPDNIAPALFGGLTASMVKDGVPYTVQYSVSDSLYFCALIPDFETSTHEARKVLPKSVDYKDAVYNVSRTAVMLKALESGNEILLSAAVSDKLHEPYRMKLIHGFEVVRALALSLGAIAFFISGSGSTLMCITKDPDFGEKMNRAMKEFPNEWEAVMLKISKNGVEVIDAE